MGGQIRGIVFVHKTDNQTKVFQLEKKKKGCSRRDVTELYKINSKG